MNLMFRMNLLSLINSINIKFDKNNIDLSTLIKTFSEYFLKILIDLVFIIYIYIYIMNFIGLFVILIFNTNQKLPSCKIQCYHLLKL
jgi:hypothetical protein